MVAFLGRRLIWFLVPALIAVSGMVAETMVPIAVAEAQTVIKRRSIFDRLFNRRRARPEPVVREQRRPVRRSGKRSTRRSSVTRLPKRPPAVAKVENASRVLVAGDFQAKSLAEGLETAFSQAPGVAIVHKTNGSSGLVRDDYYNWPETLPGVLDETKPAVAIVMLGSNDRQPLRNGGQRVAVHSDPWVTEYTKRVDEMAQAIRSRGIPLVWVGAPAYKSASMSTDILAINGIFRSVVGDAGGEFIDIWDGFVDENGKFIYTGSDIKGQQVRLRTKDGIRMTKAGRRKLAFYVEKSVRRLLGDEADEGTGKLGEDNLPELLVLDPNRGDTLTVRTSPIDMSDPALDGEQALLGAENPRVSQSRTPRDELVFDGKTTAPPPGRADHFVWPKVRDGPTL